MSRPDFSRHMQEDARLVILKELASQTNDTLSERILHVVIEAFGHNRSQDWLRTQLRAMADVGAIKITEQGTVLIATITAAGHDHLKRRVVIEGIARPTSGD